MGQKTGVNKVADQILELAVLLRKNIFIRKKDESHVEKTGQIAVLFILDKAGNTSNVRAREVLVGFQA